MQTTIRMMTTIKTMTNQGGAMIDRNFIDAKPCLMEMEPPAMKPDQVPSIRKKPEPV